MWQAVYSMKDLAAIAACMSQEQHEGAIYQAFSADLKEDACSVERHGCILVSTPSPVSPVSAGEDSDCKVLTIPRVTITKSDGGLLLLQL